MLQASPSNVIAPKAAAMSHFFGCRFLWKDCITAEIYVLLGCESSPLVSPRHAAVYHIPDSTLHDWDSQVVSKAAPIVNACAAGGAGT